MQRCCTQKAGNMLEPKTLLEDRAVTENGIPFFQDCHMSVGIYWNGILYDPSLHMQETRNEIDVVLMHGCTPLFISCKKVRLATMSCISSIHSHTASASPHAEKVLIATELDRKSPAANSSFAQRAWDMDIFLVTDAAERSPSQ